MQVQSIHKKAVRLCVRPSVPPSVKCVVWNKTKESSAQIFIPYERTFILVFRHNNANLILTELRRRYMSRPDGPSGRADAIARRVCLRSAALLSNKLTKAYRRFYRAAAMQGCLSYRKAVRLSVCLCVKGMNCDKKKQKKNFCPHSYTIWRIEASSLLT